MAPLTFLLYLIGIEAGKNSTVIGIDSYHSVILVHFQAGLIFCR